MLYSGTPIFTKAQKIIQQNGVIIYPTETFFAIGCSVFSFKAVSKIFRIKNRELHQALPIIIGKIEQVNLVAKNIPAVFQTFCEEFWPGPVTIILDAADNLPEILTANSKKIALRLSSHPIAQELAKICGPIVSTSANFSGESPAKNLAQLNDKIKNLSDIIIDLPPEPQGGLASTIIELIPKNNKLTFNANCSSQKNHIKQDYHLKILRSGAINKEFFFSKNWSILTD